MDAALALAYLMLAVVCILAVIGLNEEKMR
jgi:hypothetical protein